MIGIKYRWQISVILQTYRPLRHVHLIFTYNSMNQMHPFLIIFPSNFCKSSDFWSFIWTQKKELLERWWVRKLRRKKQRPWFQKKNFNSEQGFFLWWNQRAGDLWRECGCFALFVWLALASWNMGYTSFLYLCLFIFCDTYISCSTVVLGNKLLIKRIHNFIFFYLKYKTLACG